jgi:IS30 family transposase
MATGYHHLTEKDRETCSALLQDGKSQKAIAKRLKRNIGTISRELKRNKTLIGPKNNNNPQAKKSLKNSYYFPHKAQKKYNERRKESKQGCPLKTLDLHDYVIEKLKIGWSPQIISGRAKKEAIGKISAECIYQFIYGKDGKSLKLWECLPRHRKKRRTKSGRKGKRHLIPHRIDISLRPKSVENRKEFGHWEGDSIVGIGTKSALHTQVERLSRYTQVRKIGRKTAQLTSTTMIDIFQNFPDFARKSSTEDNGCEFTRWEMVAQELDMKIYFAQPYHSWERGTNERMNGFVRKFFPKRTDFDPVSQSEIQAVQDWINHRPMACLNYSTPHEVFHKHLNRGQKQKSFLGAKEKRE